MKKLLSLLVLVAMLAAACSGNPQPPQQEPERITLNVLMMYANYSLEDVRFMKETVAAKFPQYDFQFIDTYRHEFFDGAENKIIYLSYRQFEEAGIVPDLIIEPVHVSSSPMFTQGYTRDLESILRGTSIDLSAFEPAYLNHVRALSDDGVLAALPLSADLYAIGYNKGSVDPAQLANVETWQELAAFAERTGLNAAQAASWIPLGNQFGLRYLNERDEVELNRDRWEEAVAVYQSLQKLGIASFFAVSSSSFYDPMTAQQIPFEWDLLPYPKKSAGDAAGANRLYHIAAVGPASEHAAEALSVLEYLVSSEYQLAGARRGIASVLNDSRVREEFGADSSVFADKNTAAFFALSPSGTPNRISKYERIYWSMGTPDYMLLTSLTPVFTRMRMEQLSPEEAVKAFEASIMNVVNVIKGLPPDSY